MEKSFEPEPEKRSTDVLHGPLGQVIKLKTSDINVGYLHVYSMNKYT